MDLIRVGAFELYPSERRLCSAGRPVEIGSRAFDLLLVLVENPGRLVTKATLIERVWPRLVVDENNLPAQVASLRRILGAGAIRTVPRFGYRLDLEVSAGESGGREEAASARDTALRVSIPRRSWPERLSPLVGRAEEANALQAALARERLVTLVGGAGVGKTRLAQEILARESKRADAAVAWVPLEPLDDPGRLPSAIALALGLDLPDAPDLHASLRQALERLPILLILDGAEHLAGAIAAPVAALISESSGLRVLVTSQLPLGIAGETVHRLPPLPAGDAAALFVQRARQADRRLDSAAWNDALVDEICRRLDGNPLALELAAARVPSFGLPALLDRLDDRFRLLKRGDAFDPRHGVLRAAFDWSYGLLTPAEQRLFDRLGAFAGSFSLDCASRSVADESLDPLDAIDRIGRLVDRSLVTVLPTEPPRYALSETARCYAQERLASTGALPDSRRRMAEALLQTLDRAYEEYWSTDEAAWLNQYEPEIDNVRAAVAWAGREDAELAVALHGSAWPLFAESDLHAETRAGHEEAIALLRDSLQPARVARFWEAVAACATGRQCDRARYAAELAAGLHQAADDDRSRYFALMQLVANGLHEPSGVRGAFDVAKRLERPDWPARILAHGAMVEGMLLTAEGDYPGARDAHRRALGYALTTSERQALAATACIVELDIACGATAAALQLGRPLAISLRYSGRRETRYELLALNLGALLLADERDEAKATAAELHELARRLDPGRLDIALEAMALLAARDGRAPLSARIAHAADAARERHGRPRRRPAEERLREATGEILDRQLGPGWSTRAAAQRTLSESEACEMALGLREPERAAQSA
jgi:predicted ATPase/DNA-binding winged helix-turn-helix (wHTH) protein